MTRELRSFVFNHHRTAIRLLCDWLPDQLMTSLPLNRVYGLRSSPPPAQRSFTCGFKAAHWTLYPCSLTRPAKWEDRTSKPSSRMDSPIWLRLEVEKCISILVAVTFGVVDFDYIVSIAMTESRLSTWQ
ncbi:hypothetical protein VFPPC_15152 [Pochonia chlamydosporia 170]|uniref:Uncharacterized protein n=1 Tax=Pochonia chlamydosporia 170 TaxID=1380566 RepID=A0A179G3S9_METCM|nr:hypothetical protein VFPPC_15152 [Pochonia chlamydosporia 170]OAQ72512.1 hypothetical protein VFPPC_15152 [Pochonia chlamydosporia 170]